MKIELEQSGEFPDFKAMLAQFPGLSARILGYIGKQAAQQLWEEHLQGQDIDVRNYFYGSTGMPRSEGGILRRRMVSPYLNNPNLERCDRLLGIQRKQQSAGKYITRRGRPLVYYRIGRGATSVRVGSVVLNLFEHGRKLRGGGYEAGRGILGKFKSKLSGRLQDYIKDAGNVILEDWVEGSLRGWDIDDRLYKSRQGEPGITIL